MIAPVPPVTVKVPTVPAAPSSMVLLLSVTLRARARRGAALLSFSKKRESEWTEVKMRSMKREVSNLDILLL